MKAARAERTIPSRTSASVLSFFPLTTQQKLGLVWHCHASLKSNLCFLGRQVMSGVKNTEPADWPVGGSGVSFCGHHSSPQQKSIERLAGAGVCNRQSEKIIKEGRLSKRIFSSQYSC